MTSNSTGSLLRSCLQLVGRWNGAWWSASIRRGGIDGTTIDIRVILREALVSNAVHIALCHNHPSGYPEPSAADDAITQQLKRACREVDLRFIDHIILADTQYYSYADQNRL